MFEFVINKKAENKDIEEMICVLEKKYNIVFPEILKEYYMYYDGEMINYCNINTEEEPEIVSKIVALKNNEFESFKDECDSDGFIPKSMFPIAGSRGGDYYFWDSKNGGVYIFYSDDIDNPQKKADSVKEFFEMLDNSQK